MRFWASTVNWRSDPPVSKVLTMRNRLIARSERLEGSVGTRSPSHRRGGQGGGIGRLAARVGDHGKREQASGFDVFFEEITVPEFEHQQTPNARGIGAAAE